MNEQNSHLPFKLNLSHEEAVGLLGSETLFRRFRCAGWIEPLDESFDCLYPRSRVLAAQARLEQGESLPVLPDNIQRQINIRRAAARKAYGETAESYPAETTPLAYDLKEAQKLLGGLGRTSVFRWIKMGRLERIGGTRRVLITRKSVERAASE